MQYKVDATIRSTAPFLGNCEPLTAKGFAHQLLELAPTDAFNGLSRFGRIGYI
ncbi:hypothetical protein D3C81_1971470 [compost metagenome]